MTQTTRKNETISDDMAPEKVDDAPLSPPGLTRRKKMIRWGAAGLVLLALAFGIPYYIHSLSYESTDDAFIDRNNIAVDKRIVSRFI